MGSSAIKFKVEESLLIFGDKKAPDGSLIHVNFAKWFSGSTVVNNIGGPLIVYHGTDVVNIDEFCGRESIGWFSEDPAFASKYAVECRCGADSEFPDESRPNVLPLYLSIKNPLKLTFDMNDEAINAKTVVEQMGLKWNSFRGTDKAYEVINNDMFLCVLESVGYDGVLINERGFPTWTVIKSSQIKSSIGNCGLFDAESGRLTDEILVDQDFNRERMRA